MNICVRALRLLLVLVELHLDLVVVGSVCITGNWLHWRIVGQAVPCEQYLNLAVIDPSVQ